jgi:uncharacterized integral membrane protein
MTDESHDPFGFDPDPSPEPEERQTQAEQRPVQSSTGIAWGAILLLLGIALVVIFAVQNTDPVPVRFLWLEGEFSLAIVILITVGAIVLLTELIGLSYRRRRRRRRAEKEELRTLRGDS